MPNKIRLDSLLYKHCEYQQLVVEGCTEPEQNLASYAKWADFVVITAFTPTYLKTDIPSKSDGLPVSRYADHETNAGLWLIFSDFGTDTESYYWCRNIVTAKLRELVCRLIADGPYLLYTIRIK